MTERLLKDQQWNEMLDFYKDLIERSGWPIQCMHELVIAIIDSPLSKKYYPSSSHAALGISSEEDYEGRLERPMVYILCDENVENFEVSFQRGQGNDSHKSKFAIKQVKEMLQDVDNWLSNAK